MVIVIILITCQLHFVATQLDFDVYGCKLFDKVEEDEGHLEVLDKVRTLADHAHGPGSVGDGVVVGDPSLEEFVLFDKASPKDKLS